MKHMMSKNTTYATVFKFWLMYNISNGIDIYTNM